jgi:branched-chain amino acid transport system substrate-binding protein
VGVTAPKQRRGNVPFFFRQPAFNCKYPARKVPFVQRHRVAASALAAAALLSSSLASRGAQAEEFKIGFAMSLTGPNAVVGKATLPGAQAGIEMINASGGIGGVKAALVICDVQSVEQQAVICVRKLTLQDKVNMVFATGSTPQTLAVVPTIEAAGVPLFSVASGSVVYNPVKKWVFKGISGQADTIPPEVDYFKAKNMHRIAMIHDNGPLGSDISRIFKENISGSGIEVVDTEVYSPTDTDVTAQVTHMRSSNPEAVLNVAITPPAGALIVKTMTQLGMEQPDLVGQNLQSESFAKLAGDGIKNVIFPASKVVVEDLPKSDPLYANVVAFRQQFAKVNPDTQPTSLSPWLVDGMILAQKAATSLGAKALDNAALRDAIEGLKKVPGIEGIWTFNPEDHGSDLRDGIVLVKYDNGKWIPVH